MITASQLRVAGRRALPWLVGPAALMLRGGPIEMTLPSRCPGLLELISVSAVPLAPDLAVGPVLGGLQPMVTPAALAGFVELARRSVRSICMASAAGLAVGLSPLFARALAPPWE